MVNDDNITTTHEPGDGGKTALAIALGFAVAVGVVWYIIDGMPTGKIAVLFVLVSVVAIVSFLLGRNTQRVEYHETARAADDAYDRGREDLIATTRGALQIAQESLQLRAALSALQQPAQTQLPRPEDGPRWEHVGGGHYLSTPDVIDDAKKLLALHQRGVKVTRSVAAGEGITDPARYQAAIAKLQRWGYVREMRQGAAPEWIDEQDG